MRMTAISTISHSSSLQFRTCDEPCITMKLLRNTIRIRIRIRITTVGFMSGTVSGWHGIIETVSVLSPTLPSSIPRIRTC